MLSIDQQRVILPTFGTLTGGLRSYNDALNLIMRRQACAVLTGKVSNVLPIPRE